MSAAEKDLSAEFAQQLLAKIKRTQEESSRKKPLLGSFAMRIPVGMHRQLQRAARKHGITQTDIILQGLKQILPVLLSEEDLQRDLLEEGSLK